MDAAAASAEGSGDDLADIKMSSFSSNSLSQLDGGTGTDTLSFDISTGISNGTTLTLTSYGASNFENISGSAANETIQGDSSDNIINEYKKGGSYGSDSNGGTDSMYGYDGNDTIYGQGYFYGGAGNDTLEGSNTDDTFDGGTGSDTITTGTGSDVIVIRTGDGGSTIADADVIKDFTDGTDVIGLATGSGALAYTDLTIAQGLGSNAAHVLVSKTSSSEYIAMIENINVSNVNYYDFVSMATGSQTLTGTTGDDVLLGASGVDTITTNTGTDVVLGYGGDDAITINGSGSKTIDGGSGTDSLNVTILSNLSSISNLSITS